MTDPAYLKAFKELIRSEPTFVDLPRMESEFYGESPRAIILLSATLTELALETALKHVLRPGKETETLFDFEAPLGTFSGKIKLCFAMKLFGTKTLHDFELIRHLRNGFAHTRHPLDFNTPQIAGVCKHLMLPDEQIGFMPSKIPSAYLARATKEEAGDLAHPKTRYVTACNIITVALITFGRPREGSPALEPPLLP
jgi:hypothetical protein